MEVDYRIKDAQKWFMLATAAVFDLLQVLSAAVVVVPGVGFIFAFIAPLFVSFIAWLLFDIIWFTISRRTFRDARLVRLLLALELLPGLSWLPSWTVYVWANIHAMRKRDKTEARKRRLDLSRAANNARPQVA